MRISLGVVGALGLTGCYREAIASKDSAASAATSAPAASGKEDLRAELQGLFGGSKENDDD